MFDNRTDAGRQLGRELRPHLSAMGEGAVVVAGLPRGGVVVAAAVAAELGLPLHVILVRKLGLPAQPEVAMGAIGTDGVRVVDDDLVRRTATSPEALAAVEQRERAVLDRRAAELGDAQVDRDLSGRTILIVDDGIATGATATAASLVARARGAARVVVAAPVGGADASRNVHGADEVICLEQPVGFRAVGAHYRDFDQTTDAEVIRLLARRGGAD